MTNKHRWLIILLAIAATIAAIPLGIIIALAIASFVLTI